MPLPTTGLYLNQTTPAVPAGDQAIVFQSDGGTPEQQVTAYAPQASITQRGTVKPDGTTIVIAEDGTISAIATSSTGGPGGSGSGAGAYEMVQPSGTVDGANRSYVLPTQPEDGTDLIVFKNGVAQDPFAPTAEFSLTGATILMTTAPSIGERIRVWYVAGAQTTEPGGGGGVTTQPTIRASGSGFGTSGYPVVAIPAGAQAGDFCLIFAGAQYNLTGVPSGWTQVNVQSGSTWNGVTISKVLTSSDITAGSVTITTTSGFFPQGGEWATCVAVFVGSTSGVREQYSVDFNGGGSPTTFTTTSAVAATDSAFYFLSLETGPSTPAVASISRGAQLQTTSDPAYASSAVLYSEAITTAGAFSATFDATPESSNPAWYASMVIVAA